MQVKSDDRRRFDRVVFDINDGLTAALRDKETEKVRAHVYILNLSEKGMQFTTKSTDRSPFQVDEQAILSDLYLNDHKFQNLDIEILVRWILNPPILKYIGVGCEFLQMPETSRKSIEEILHIKKI